mmetsp:Transcript_9995/g.32396  ORF Transcript_9995/g.32396 Transcript_9995/m.32396 type:complete len:111 (-) Transcript_9995:88-420(-)
MVSVVGVGLCLGGGDRTLPLSLTTLPPLQLNDKWNLDGTCPNGVVGCMWSICGIHDQGWAERPVFGKIRYMNYNGCKRKFKIEQYVAYVEKNKALGPDKAMWGSRFTTVK